MDNTLISAFNFSLNLETLQTLRQEHASDQEDRTDHPRHHSSTSKDLFVLGDYRIDLDRPLGRGAFGEVFRGHDPNEKIWVAAKQVKLLDRNSREDRLLKDEIESLRMLNGHENIVKLYEAFFDEDSTWLVMDYCDLGDMDSFFVNCKPNMSTCLKVTYMCASAVAYMHNQSIPIVHRDIKPANVLMKSRNGEVVVKMTDFGLAKIIENNPAAYTMYMQTFCGTYAFMAPELILQKAYTRSVDVFALGLVYLAMLQFKSGMKRLTPKAINMQANSKSAQTGNTPIAILMVGAHDPKEGSRNPIPILVRFSKTDNHVVRQLKHAVKEMTHYESKKRPKMADIKEHLEELLQDMAQNPINEEQQLFQGDDERVEVDDDLSLEEDTSNSESDSAFETVVQKLRVGDWVCAIEDVTEVKKLQEDMLGVWSEEVIPFLGKKGRVIKVTPSFVKVEYTHPQERKLTLHLAAVRLYSGK